MSLSISVSISKSRFIHSVSLHTLSSSFFFISAEMFYFFCKLQVNLNLKVREPDVNMVDLWIHTLLV